MPDYKYPSFNDREFDLLKKLTANTAFIAENGGGGGGGGTPGGLNTQLQRNNSGSFGGITGATSNGTFVTLTSPVLVTPALGVATATSINGNAITTGTGTLTLGSVTLNAGPGGTLGSAAFTESDIYGTLASANTFTALNTFSLVPNVPWTSKATGSSTSTLDTKYYISSFTANTTITSYVGTPVSGSTVAYRLIDCNGTATFSFPSAQRSGDPTGASTVITPTLGTHDLVFTYTNGAWYYQDNIVSNTVAAGTTGRVSFTAYAPIFGGTTSTGALQSGTVGNAGEALISNGAGALPTFQTISATLTSTQVGYGSGSNLVTGEAAFTYTAASNLLTVGAVSLGAGGETSTVGGFQTSDGNFLNQSISTVASGTAFPLTASYATLDFGTTDPVVVINSAGTYMIVAVIQTDFSGATYAALQSVTYKLRRTNNTAADLSGSAFGDMLPIMTGYTGLGPTVTIVGIKYTTTNTDDSITIQGILSATPSAGSTRAVNATITAWRLY